LDILIFILGATLGSFLAMLSYRLPLSISLVNPKRSFCPNCNYQIKWYENIPIVSYLFLKARCSSCGIKISIIYLIVELISGVIALVLYWKFSLSFDFWITLGVFYLLLLLSFIDLKYKAVPDYLLILVVTVSFFVYDFSLLFALAFGGGFALLELFVTFYIQNIKAKILKDDTLKEQRAMGEGDIPIAAVIGGVLGLKLGLFAIFTAALLAIIPALYSNIFKKDIETPFIPYLSLGLFITYIYQENITIFLTGVLK